MSDKAWTEAKRTGRHGSGSGSRRSGRDARSTGLAPEAETILALQSRIGNAAVADLIVRGGPVGLRDEAEGSGAETTPRRVVTLLPGSARPPAGAKWRVPPSADLQSMLSAGRVDGAVVHSRVRRLLDRMDREGRLRTPDSVDLDVVMNEIFPGPGMLDVAAYERYIDPADRTMVYHSVRQMETAPRAAERSDLQSAMRDAAATAQAVAADEAGLRAVFGPGWAAAQNNYGLIHARLIAVAGNIAAQVTTDYNLDAQETFLGGWALFGTQHMHLLSQVVADPLTAESKATILHEGAHLAASSIDDHVYYGTSGFEAADHATKKNNAAHYEELPRRVWGASRYPRLTFRPGRSSSGARLSTDERIRAAGVEYFRKAWDAASEFDRLLKMARWDQLNRLSLDAPVEARLLEVSALMDLTLHEQAASSPRISRLDVSTSESITRAMGLAEGQVGTLANVTPMGPFQSPAAEIKAGVDLVVDGAMAAYGGMLGDPARDRRLTNWLHNHYRHVNP